MPENLSRLNARIFYMQKVRHDAAAPMQNTATSDTISAEK